MSGDNYDYEDQTRQAPTHALHAPSEVTQADSNPAFYPASAKSEAMQTEAERNGETEQGTEPDVQLGDPGEGDVPEESGDDPTGQPVTNAPVEPAPVEPAAPEDGSTTELTTGPDGDTQPAPDDEDTSSSF